MINFHLILKESPCGVWRWLVADISTHGISVGSLTDDQIHSSEPDIIMAHPGLRFLPIFILNVVAKASKDFQFRYDASRF